MNKTAKLAFFEGYMEKTAGPVGQAVNKVIPEGGILRQILRDKIASKMVKARNKLRAPKKIKGGLLANLRADKLSDPFPSLGSVDGLHGWKALFSAEPTSKGPFNYPQLIARNATGKRFDIPIASKSKRLVPSDGKFGVGKNVFGMSPDPVRRNVFGRPLSIDRGKVDNSFGAMVQDSRIARELSGKPLERLKIRLVNS